MVKKLSPSYHNKQVTTLDNGNFQSPYPEKFKLISTIIMNSGAHALRNDKISPFNKNKSINNTLSFNSSKNVLFSRGGILKSS